MWVPLRNRAQDRAIRHVNMSVENALILLNINEQMGAIDHEKNWNVKIRNKCS